MEINLDPVYAHTLPNTSCEHWELLSAHLEEVAVRCKSYAAAFRASEWGWVVGRCHDLGKASVEFQSYIQSANLDREDAGEEFSSPRRVNHSTFGARYIDSALPTPFGRILAFCIAGHHAGLADAFPSEDVSSQGSLSGRLDPKITSIPVAPSPPLALPSLALPLQAKRAELAFTLAFFTRMLFSCLIDADRTCTEAFCQPDQAQERALPRPSLEELRVKLDAHLEELQNGAKATTVNTQRRLILSECLRAASGKPGFYSLQVPTGGGKTLSSLAFALHHAPEQMRRVVVAIPFTSIIDQTADEYRKALGSCAERGIVEHHTNLRPERNTRANQLAAENWDAPLVVTTNVQLFESLFAASPSPCRKLHRLANSVVILDEAQTLPVDLLEPTLRALQELVRNYGCTVVLCTATQPALERRDDFNIGLENVTPIISNPKKLFETMRRVSVAHAGKLTDDVLASRISIETQVLCIVNTRKHAAKIFDLVSAEVEKQSLFHLSTLMCAEHRRATLKTIRKRLLDGLPCRVISTQLIEAGVNIDLPVVYRAAAGFDSIAQAAGRCNREGIATLGMTYVFEPEELPPSGFLRQVAETAKGLWLIYSDPLAPEAVEEYFRLLYWKNTQNKDKYGIMELMEVDKNRPRDLHFQFRSIEEKYKLIRDTQLPVLVPYDKTAEDLIAELEDPFIDYVAQRRLQPYLVSIPERALRELEASAVVKAHDSGVWILSRKDVYKDDKGLLLGSIGLDPSLWNV